MDPNDLLKAMFLLGAGIGASLRLGTLPTGTAQDPGVIATRNRWVEEVRFQYALLAKAHELKTSQNPDVDFGWQSLAASHGGLSVGVQTPGADVMAAFQQIVPLFPKIAPGTPLANAAQVLAALQGVVNVAVPPVTASTTASGAAPASK